MPVENDADRAVFVDPDDFGVAATYTPVAGGAVTMNGIFDNGFAEAGRFGETAIASTEPRFTCRTGDLPNGFADGDLLSVNGTDYRVKVPEPDTTGEMTELVLVKD